MVIFILISIWVISAETPLHFLLAFLVVISRIFYVSGDTPTKPFAFLPLWILSFIVTYLFLGSNSEALGNLAIWFLKILILGVLALHLISLPSTQRIVYRIPHLRSLLMLTGRGVIILRRVVHDMQFSTNQIIALAKDSATGRFFLVKFWLVSKAYVFGKYQIAASILQEGVRLEQRWTSVVMARGGFPTDKFSYVPLSVRANSREWYSNIVGDIIIFLLILVPVIMQDDELVPSRILTFAERIKNIFL